MVSPMVPSEGVISSLQPPAILVDDALERRWEVWQEKGRVRDRLVRKRMGLIAAIAAITLSFWLSF
jgi:hypothetical protein